jgi:hypothetical protein
MFELMGLIVVLGGLVGLFPFVLIGRWILGPIDQAAKSREAPVRFSIGDFLCLFLAVQIPLTAIYQFVGEDEKPVFWLFTIITWLVAPVIWFACARALSKAGVTRGKHRILFLALVMPIVYYALLPFVILSMVGIGALVVGNAAGPWQTGWLVVAWVVVAGTLYVCGLYTRWMISLAEPSDWSYPIASRKPSEPSEPVLTEWQRRLQSARAAVKQHSEISGQAANTSAEAYGYSEQFQNPTSGSSRGAGEGF